MTKQQLLHIHGGETFHDHADYIQYLHNRTVSLEPYRKWQQDYEQLIDAYDIIRPQMPCKEHAQYTEWKIRFEHYIPLLKDNCVLVGNSLGGTFLAKYLSENIFPHVIAAAFLLVTPFDDDMSEDDLAGGFELGDDLSLLEKNCPNLIMYFMDNDTVIPVSHAKKFAQAVPHADIHVLSGKEGHCIGSEFSELIHHIQTCQTNK